MFQTPLDVPATSIQWTRSKASIEALQKVHCKRAVQVSLRRGQRLFEHHHLKITRAYIGLCDTHMILKDIFFKTTCSVNNVLC